MSRKSARPFSTRELAELARIWPSVATDGQVCDWFDRDKHTLARVARDTLGLPTSRVEARAAAFEATKDDYREPDGRAA